MTSWILLVVVFYLSILLHELAHALTGMAFGMQVTGIVLGIPPLFRLKIRNFSVGFGLIPLAGYTSFTEEMEDHRAFKRFLVILAGPVVSFITGVAGMTIGIYFAGRDVLARINVDPVDYCGRPMGGSLLGLNEMVSSAVAAHGFLGFLAVFGLINFALALVNMLPIPPLDGGRLLFIVVEAIFPSIRAKNILRFCFTVVSVGFLLVNVWFIAQDVWLIGRTVLKPVC